jgi:light-regulated signal transduction histidine kinase (bacteriophytochrome)
MFAITTAAALLLGLSSAAPWLSAAMRWLAAVSAVAAVWSLFRAAPLILALPSAAQAQAARDATAHASRELEEFTASVSHDLRSPLSSIAGQAGLLEIALGDQASDDQRRRLQRIQTSVRQMSELIESLLMLSRISRAAVTVETVDLTSLAQEIAAELQQREPARQAQFQIQPGMTAAGDRKLLRTLVTSLMNNAWRFTSRAAPARIEVQATATADHTTLEVRDNGLGFDMAYADKLFKPFQKLHGSEWSGSGIGLATVKRIVERHGGQAWAHSQVDEGAAFYCSLPSATAGAKATVRASSTRSSG